MLTSTAHNNVFELFKRQALKTPKNVCLKLYPKKNEATYAEVLNIAELLASQFENLGLQIGDKILIEGTKSIISFSLLLAALKMGITYSFYDPKSPLKRLDLVVKALKPNLIFCDQHLSDEFSETTQIISFSNIEEILTEAEKANKNTTRVRSLPAGTVAYVIFTSGSTGTPKGVCISHNNLFPFINWAKECFHVNSKTIGTNVNPLFFDNSVFDIYSIMFNGGTLVSIDTEKLKKLSDIVEIVQKENCTQWFSVPSMLIYLNTVKCITSDKISSLRNIIFGGEGYPVPLLKKLFTFGDKKTNFWNVYGPSECTCISNAAKIEKQMLFNTHTPFYNLGKVLNHFDCYIDYLATDKKPNSSENQSGELVLIGPSVGEGYINEEDIEQSGFFNILDHKGNLKKAYRTGDIFTEDGDGNLYFVGRSDNQVKRSGYRIELQEIEAAVVSTQLAQEAIAVAHTIANQTQITLFVTSMEKVTEKLIQKQLSECLNTFMLPDKIIISNNFLIKNQNGKVDRKFYSDLAKTHQE